MFRTIGFPIDPGARVRLCLRGLAGCLGGAGAAAVEHARRPANDNSDRPPPGCGAGFAARAPVQAAA